MKGCRARSFSFRVDRLQCGPRDCFTVGPWQAQTPRDSHFVGTGEGADQSNLSEGGQGRGQHCQAAPKPSWTAARLTRLGQGLLLLPAGLQGASLKPTPSRPDTGLDRLLPSLLSATTGTPFDPGPARPLRGAIWRRLPNSFRLLAEMHCDSSYMRWRSFPPG